MDKIGFIGLGNMGKPLAERLLKNYQLYVYDLDTKNLKYFLDKGALACSSPSDLASNTSRIFLCLPTSTVVEKVIYGENGLIKTTTKGSFIIDMTTGEPEITRKISKTYLTKGTKAELGKNEELQAIAFKLDVNSHQSLVVLEEIQTRTFSKYQKLLEKIIEIKNRRNA